ncbi:MAG: DUF5990 family protein [Pyrinomonadaceae bacterium]
MKHEIILRILVVAPLQGVAMMVQDGKDKLLPPLESTADTLQFEFPITVDMSSASPNFLGRFAQGPKDARFVYVNSGTYAGHSHSCWGRRAKVSLMTINREQIEKAVAGKTVIETCFPGVGKDGGPTCASVKGIEWKVVGR